jgi:hypothetical protein
MNTVRVLLVMGLSVWNTVTSAQYFDAETGCITTGRVTMTRRSGDISAVIRWGCGVD